MQQNRPIGLLFEEDFHYIDHMVPFCSYFRLPVLVTEKATEALCKKYYPHTKVYLQEIASLRSFFQNGFSRVYYCFTSEFLEGYLGSAPLFPKLPLEKIWLPHGFSEKDNYEGLRKEKALLIYGNAMKKRLKAKKISATYHSFANIRLLYFLENLSFYRPLVEKLFSPLNPNLPTFLYAPTWEDSFSSFSFSETKNLLENFPPKVNLVIQFHPNTQKKRAFEIELLKAQYEDRSFLFLESFTPIYPLLDRIDAYLGNASSIHYDLLFFPEKPLFFLSKEFLTIHEVGTLLETKEIPCLLQKYEKIKRKDPHLQKKKKLYFSTFS